MVRACTHHPLRRNGACKHTPCGGTMKRPMSDARIGGIVATVVLVAMFAFVGLFIWMGS